MISASDSVSSGDDVLNILAGVVMAEPEFARLGYSLVVVGWRGRANTKRTGFKQNRLSSSAVMLNYKRVWCKELAVVFDDT